MIYPITRIIDEKIDRILDKKKFQTVAALILAFQNLVRSCDTLNYIIKSETYPSTTQLSPNLIQINTKSKINIGKNKIMEEE